MNPLVALIVSQPGMAERLLAEHADDRGRCRVCSSGVQGARHRFPCSIHEHARQARTLQRGRRPAPAEGGDVVDRTRRIQNGGGSGSFPGSVA